MNGWINRYLKHYLIEDLTVYALHKKIGGSYPTVLRHVKKLLKEEYIVECKGKRNASILSLTPKGLVLLVFEGDIGKRWASLKEQEESFELFLKMLSDISKRSKTVVGDSCEG